MASLFLIVGTAWAQAPEATPEQAITGLLNRIGGNGAADKFEIVIDAKLAENGKDVFVITSQNGKPCIKGNTQLSVATGINWYLNHYAHINLTWNNLTTDLSAVNLPVPGSEEKHVSSAKYRYDFNTCTFSYSMAFWTWDRWQQEIDWMALHGINAPLNLVGLDVVTRKFLKELGVSESDIDAYIAGPGFIAWFAMNNLEGWGGTINSSSTGVDMSGNPDWWYTRQEQLSRNMLQRMRELGMQPVIPGFSGQVPNCIVNYSINGFSSGDVVNNGTWAGGYTRPDILKPNTESYRTFAAVYYKHLHEVMGVSELYSIDPFHEGSLPGGVTNATCYPNIMVELDKHFGNVEQSVKDTYKVTQSPSWMIQYWQGVPQSGAFTAMKNAGYSSRFIGLDLFADNIYADNAAKWRTNYYDTCPYIYCMLHNFGGRSGLHGRLETTMDGYFQALAKNNNCQGIGATPEGTETNPILYDMLFELPWMNSNPGADAWLEEYAHSRYGVQNDKALSALKNLKKSVWDCKVNQQGTSEAVILARPNWTVGSVSSWSTSAIYWDTQNVLQAADELYAIKDIVTANGGQDGIANYNYDFIDVVRQSMVDYAAQLLPLINAARGNDAEYTRLYQLYLQLMLDLDTMLSYDENFKLERWTSLARNIADEVAGTTENDRNWLEWNARTQVTVWSKGDTDLHDYSNRCWSGLIKDFHYKRWKHFFENNGNAPSGGWFSGFEYPWTVDFNETHDLAGDYSKVVIPTDVTATEKAAETFGKYFGRVKGATKNYIFPMGVTTNATKSGVIPEVYRGKTVELPLIIGKNVTISSVWVDLNNDDAKGNGETLTADNNQVAIPADAAIGKTTAQVVYSDGTDITFSLALVEDITDARTVTAVAGANGSVAIEGTNELSITNTEAVKMTATANTGYNFENWTDAAGNVVSNDNPFIYYDKEDATFTANFIENKWGVVTCAPDKDNEGNVKDEATVMGDINSNNQYIHNLTLSYYNREAETIYEPTAAPTSIFTTVPQIVNVPQGASFTVEYDKGIDNKFQHCYFRAYIDLNVDGDFDDEGELLKEVGTRGAQNTAVCSNKINVLLPYDMPLGITHMRLRFDSAWNIGDNAKSQSVRPVYDIVLNVTEKSDKAAIINVVTNNADWGTVEVWTDETPDGSTATSWNVSSNIPMYLRATKTSEDVEFLGWYDHYGRLLTENLEHTMYAREDATYTAQFRKELDIDGWVFEYRTEPGVVILTRVRQSGDHDLVIPETVEILGEQCKIVGLDNGVFNNNKDLWSITMPKSMEFLSNYILFETSVKGENTPTTSGDNNPDGKVQVINLGGLVLKNSESWKVVVEYESDGISTYNQWGTPLLYATGDGTGTELFYLSSKNSWSTCWHVRSPFSGLGNDYFKEHTDGKFSKFTAVLENKGNGKALVTVINSEGVAKTSSEVSFTNNNISAFSARLPKGLNITKFMVQEAAESNPFSGCSNLGSIAFSEACANYYVAQDGDLYNSINVLICSPEGKDKAGAIRNLGTLIDNTKALMDIIATSIDSVGKATEIAMQSTKDTEPYYIWCSNPHKSGNDGKGGVPALLDEDANTYLHTNWDNATKSKTHDYLQINNVNPEDLRNFKIAGQQRADGSDDRPKNIEIYGSNDDSDWTLITTVTGLPDTGGATWSSSNLTSNSKYSYLKFVVKTHDNENNVNRPYFHMAKFDLFKLTSVVEVAEEYKEHAGITNDEAANVYDNLVNALYVYNNGGTAEEMQTAYDALEPLYTALNDKIKLKYVREINELVSATEELINAIATSVDPVGKATEIALSTTEGAYNNYIWCNAPTANEGVGNLLDNQDGTILHTAWQSGAVSAYDHYLLIELADGEDLSNFKFRYKARTGNSNQMNFGDIPSGIKVYGSMKEDGGYDELYTISGLTQSSGHDWTSPSITGSPSYRYLRFNVTANSGFWHMAEFDLFKVASDIEVAPDYKNFGGITNEEAEAAYDNMVKAQALCTTGTATELEAALEALRTSYEALNAKKGTVLNGYYNISWQNGETEVPMFIGYNEVDDDWVVGEDHKGYKILGADFYTTDAVADKIFSIVPQGDGFTITAQGKTLKSPNFDGWHHVQFSDDENLAGIYKFHKQPDLADAYKIQGVGENDGDVWTHCDYLEVYPGTTNQPGSIVGNNSETIWDSENQISVEKASIFTLTPVTEYNLTIPESGMTTLCLPFNVVLPEGVVAYDIVNASKEALESGENLLEEIASEGDILLAGTPVILRAENATPLTITLGSNGGKTSKANSCLRGNFVKQDLKVEKKKKYVLQEGKFVPLTVDTEISANTCWVVTDIDDENANIANRHIIIDGWEFEYTEEEEEAAKGRITLVRCVKEGDPELDIESTYIVNGEKKTVVAIDPEFLHGNEFLTKVTIPESMLNLGFREIEPMFEGEYEGQLGDGATYEGNQLVGEAKGLNRDYIFPNDTVTGEPYVVGGNDAWKLTLDVTIDDTKKTSFNNYGSAIVSTKSNSLDDDYKGYMQIYMWADLQHIVVKIDNSDDRYAYSTYVLDENGNETSELLVNKHFTFELEHDGAGGYQVVIYYDNGKAKMYNIAASDGHKVQDFDKLYYSLPEGIKVDVKFEKLITHGLFVGCTNLQRIEVDPANPTFMSCDHGVLYDKNQYYVMRIPEGETSHHFEIPSKVVKLYPGAVHGVSADIVLHSNPQIGVVEGHEDHVENAKFYLSLDDIDNTITENETGYGGARDFVSANNNHYQQARYKRTPLAKDVYGTLCLPFDIKKDNAIMDKYDFYEFRSANETSLIFKQVTELKHNKPYLYKLKDSVEEGYNIDRTTGCDVFESAGAVNIETLAKFDDSLLEGDITALGAFVNYYVETYKYANKAFYYYKTTDKSFWQVTQKLTYRPYRAFFVVNNVQATQATPRLSLQLLDGTTTDIDATLVEDMFAPELYDLSGRRVLNPVNGGIYIVNGKKVFIK